MNKKRTIGAILYRIETQWLRLGKKYPDDVDKAIEALRDNILSYCEKKSIKFVHRHRLSIVFDSRIFNNLESETIRVREEFVRVTINAFANAIYRGNPLMTTLCILETVLEEMFSDVGEIAQQNRPERNSGLTTIK